MMTRNPTLHAGRYQQARRRERRQASGGKDAAEGPDVLEQGLADSDEVAALLEMSIAYTKVCSLGSGPKFSCRSCAHNTITALYLSNPVSTGIPAVATGIHAF